MQHNLYTVKLGLEGPPGPGQGLCRWPLQAPHGKGRGTYQTLWSLRAPEEPQACFPRNPAILLHCLKESSRKKLLNALVRSICRCEFVENDPKTRFLRWGPLRFQTLRPLVRFSSPADSKLCGPYGWPLCRQLDGTHRKR